MSVRTDEDDEERRFWRALGRARSGGHGGAAVGGASVGEAPVGGEAVGGDALGGASAADDAAETSAKRAAHDAARARPAAASPNDPRSSAPATEPKDGGAATAPSEPSDGSRPSTRPAPRRRVGIEERRVAVDVADPDTRAALERHREEARRLALRTMLHAAEARASRVSRARRPALARDAVVRVLEGEFADRRATVIDADYIESRALLSFDPDEPPHWIEFGNIGAVDAEG